MNTTRHIVLVVVLSVVVQAPCDKATDGGSCQDIAEVVVAHVDLAVSRDQGVGSRGRGKVGIAAGDGSGEGGRGSGVTGGERGGDASVPEARLVISGRALTPDGVFQGHNENVGYNDGSSYLTGVVSRERIVVVPALPALVQGPADLDNWCQQGDALQGHVHCGLIVAALKSSCQQGVGLGQAALQAGYQCQSQNEGYQVETVKHSVE